MEEDLNNAYLCVMSICLPVLYILHVTRSAIQGMGNTVSPMISGIAEFVMRTAGILLLSEFLNILKKSLLWDREKN